MTYDERGGFFDHIAQARTASDGQNCPIRCVLDAQCLRYVRSARCGCQLIDRRIDSKSVVGGSPAHVGDCDGSGDVRAAGVRQMRVTSAHVCRPHTKPMPRVMWQTCRRASQAPLARPVVSTVAGVAVDPVTNHRLSHRREGYRVCRSMARRPGAALVGANTQEPLPTTQGEAADHRSASEGAGYLNATIV